MKSIKKNQRFFDNETLNKLKIIQKNIKEKIVKLLYLNKDPSNFLISLFINFFFIRCDLISKLKQLIY